MISLPQHPRVIFEEGNKAILEIEGLYPGYGQTIGNSLRRVLLSSLKGAAITSVKIQGAGHEFTTIEGVMEDAVELILNLKQVRFRVDGDGSYLAILDVKGEKRVVGGDFEAPSQIEVMNKDVHIATLSSKKSSLHLEATVETGLGYVPVEARSKDKVEVGIIALDAIFSPVRHVHYEVENMRMGDRTDYNKIRLHIETDGSLTPREAFTEAAEILMGQFEALTKEFQADEQRSDDRTQEEEESLAEKTEGGGSAEEGAAKLRIDDLKLSARTLNALREAGIKTVSGLSRKREETLREIDGIGEKGIQEVKKALESVGFSLRE